MNKFFVEIGNLKNIVAALLYFILTSTLLSAQAPPVPKLKCLSVDELTGNVRITWDSVDVNDQFYSFRIYRNDGVVLQEFEDSACSKLDYVDARLQIYSYYITTYYSGGDTASAPSDTLDTMLPAVVATNQNSIAEISWNPYKNGNGISTSTGFYTIYRRQNTDLFFSPVGTVPFGTETYRDTIFGTASIGCDSLLFQYQIGITDTVGCPYDLSQGCESLSAVSSFLIFQDNLGPDIPVIETATVNNGNIEVYWYPSSAADVSYYVVQNESDFTQVGSINSPANSLVGGSINNTMPETFLVIAYDYCGNDLSYIGSHTVMHVDNEFVECDREVKLNWTPYIGWQEGIKKYTIEYQYNGGAFTYIDSTNNTEYIHKLDTTGTFCYRIMATSNGSQRSSFSNEICQEVTYPEVNKFTYLSSVDVLSNTSLEVKLFVDTVVQYTKYELYRTLDLADDFELINTRFKLPSQEFISYIDNDVTTFDKDYFYKWRSIDVCDNLVEESNISNNMRLSANANAANFSNIIQWKPYQTWDGEIAGYNIYRKNILTNAYNLIGNTDADTHVFFENVESFGTIQGDFCYVVEAVETNNSYGFSALAKSNESCAIQPPIFWVPNAMVIDGFNNEFKPTALFLDFSKYKLEIYNRWSQIIFTSTTYKVGWNGRYNGSKVQTGPYAFYISYVDGNGQFQSQAGTVFVLD